MLNPRMLHLQILGYLLQIPAYPFWRLEAAVAPGPQQAWHQSVEQALDSPVGVAVVS